MAGITTALCNSFKTEILKAIHNFLASGGDTFKLALIKTSPAGTYNKSSTNYSDITGNSDEASGTGYTAGGTALTSVDPTLSTDTAVCDFADVSWTSATFSARGCMIYNSSKSNKAVSCHDFGGDQSVSSGTFSLIFPTANASNAIIRIA